MTAAPWVLVGGSGWIGSAVARALVAEGAPVTVVDREPPAPDLVGHVSWLARDLLVDDVELPRGRVVVLVGSQEPASPWPWTLVLDHAVTTARMSSALSGRDVVLVSACEVADAEAELDRVDRWCMKAMVAATLPMDPWRAAPTCRDLAAGDGAAVVEGLAKLAQERLLAAARPARLTILRVPHVFGPGQDGPVVDMVRDILDRRPVPIAPGDRRRLIPLAEVVEAIRTRRAPGVFDLGGPPVHLTELAQVLRHLTHSSAAILPAGADAAVRADDMRLWRLVPYLRALVEHLRAGGGPLFDPALPVIVPPRPARPDEVAARSAEALWTGRLKAGQRWSTRLAAVLAERLGVGDGDGRSLLMTGSGTAALRMAVVAVAGPARPGDVAVLPSFTYPATAEVLVQLGYELRFVDVDDATWTLDPDAVEVALGDGRVRVVVPVDTFGVPADYARLRAVCHRHGAALVADSAAGIGSTYRGEPLATQADAHAFSMSFAKTVSAGGSGGCAVIPAAADIAGRAGWDRSEGMSELHAIAGLDQIEVLDTLLARRQAVADAYRERLAGLDAVEAQVVPPGCSSSWVHFVVRVTMARRDLVAADLAAAGVGTTPYFAALHRSGYGPSQRPGSAATLNPPTAQPGLPVTDVLHQQTLALPMSSELTPEQARRVAVALERAVPASAEARCVTSG